MVRPRGGRYRYGRCRGQHGATDLVVVRRGDVRSRIAAGRGSALAHKRGDVCRLGGNRSEDFLFPQTNLGDKAARAWSPGFVDYLFLAFNTSTAFSPTDTAFLSRRTKVLMMVQALLSLVILAVLVGRAINALAA
jgi:hypothetical protein